MHTDLFKYADVYGTGTSHPPPIPFVHNPCRDGRQTVHIVCSFATQFKHMQCPIFAGKMNSQTIHSSVLY